MLKGKTVILGVTGGIAAYKAAEILRGLRKSGAAVTVVMTEHARRFVAPLTFEALSGRPVSDDLFSSRGAAMEHLALAGAADLVLVAPATANTIAKLAAGMADDLLTTLVLASTAPLLLAPAMNTRMWSHPATAANVAALAARGVHFAGPESGPLAEEQSGHGRLASPEAVLRRAVELLLPKRDLEGRRVLVTAGPTREALDPVRFISNRSSGKMGLAVAGAALRRGAAVTLVHGPISLATPGGADCVAVTTAEQMRGAVNDAFPLCDVLVMTAAVADFRPAKASPGKIKRGGRGRLVLELEPTRDILGELGRHKGDTILVGFAAETGDLSAAAAKKLAGKNLDLLVANDVTAEGAGFDVDTNRVQIHRRGRRPLRLPLMSKVDVAGRILDEVSLLLRRAAGGRRRK